MPRSTTRSLGDELERLDARLDDLVEHLADADPSTHTAQLLTNEARDIDQAGAAVDRLIEDHGEDATVTVQELDGDAWARFEDKVATLSSMKPGDGGVPGSQRNVYAASGLVRADFIDIAEDASLEETTRAIAALTPAPGVAKWLVGLIDDAGSVDTGNWSGLQARIVASGASNATSSSTTPSASSVSKPDTPPSN